jgi:hypothetical protein
VDLKCVSGKINPTMLCQYLNFCSQVALKTVLFVLNYIFSLYILLNKSSYLHMFSLSLSLTLFYFFFTKMRMADNNRHDVPRRPSLWFLCTVFLTVIFRGTIQQVLPGTRIAIRRLPFNATYTCFFLLNLMTLCIKKNFRSRPVSCIWLVHLQECVQGK